MTDIELINHPLYYDTNCVYYCRFEGNSNATKSTLNGTDANISYVTGKFGQAASFNGSSSRITLPTSTLFDSQTITISIWVKASTYNQNAFIFEKGSVNTQYSLFFESDYLNFRTMYSGWDSVNYWDSVWSNVSTIPKNAYSGLIANDWNHICATYNGSVKKVYINGSTVCSMAKSITLPTGGTSEYIGAYGGSSPSYWYNGQIDDIAFWNRALSDDEVLSLYLSDLTSPFKEYRRTRTPGPINGDNINVLASGGTETSYGSYKVHTFTGTSTLTVSREGYIDVLLVAGGGGGGSGESGLGGSGGGGAGGVIPRYHFWVPAGSYTVTIGEGGAGRGSGYAGYNGGNTTFSTLTAIGGGGGGATNNNQGQQQGVAGGCGGGAGGSRGSTGGSGSQGGAGGTATDTNPYLGGAGGGHCSGGGAGGNGTGRGGNGYYTDIRGTWEYFGGGGAGGRGGQPGLGGGGTDYAGAGTANTGGGGGGCSSSGSMTGGNGGSGIAIFRYKVKDLIY